VRTEAVIESNAQSCCRDAKALLRDLQEASGTLRACLRELEKVLSARVPDASALTSVRLKLAGLRLTRGPLLWRVEQLLAGRLTDSETATLQELRSSHDRLLQIATQHTGKWTLEAVSSDWPGYQRATREMMRRWLARAQVQQQLLHPLIQRYI